MSQAPGALAQRVIRDEHASLSVMLQALRAQAVRGPGDEGETYFDGLRAMLFYIDEFPERHHHPKETECLFPHVWRAAPDARAAIEWLDREHADGERRVRELQHLLLAWELLGEPRRHAFCTALKDYIAFYQAHMHREEQEVLALARQALTAGAWREIDAAFASPRDPLSGLHTGEFPHDPALDRLFARALRHLPERATGLHTPA